MNSTQPPPPSAPATTSASSAPATTSASSASPPASSGAATPPTSSTSSWPFLFPWFKKQPPGNPNPTGASVGGRRRRMRNVKTHRKRSVKKTRKGRKGTRHH